MAISSLTAGEGGTRGYCEIGIAITARKGIDGTEREKLYSAVMSGLTAHIALLDRAGNIVAVNEAWTRFARENDARPEDAVGVGVNYLEVCRKSAADCDSAAQCLVGIESDAFQCGA